MHQRWCEHKLVGSDIAENASETHPQTEESEEAPELSDGDGTPTVNKNGLVVFQIIMRAQSILNRSTRTLVPSLTTSITYTLSTRVQTTSTGHHACISRGDNATFLYSLIGANDSGRSW